MNTSLVRLFLAWSLLGACVTNARRMPSQEQINKYSSELITYRNNNKRITSTNGTTVGTIVGAQLRCKGYLCPQWALDISRWDLTAATGVNPEVNLIELLPLAPTFQREPTIFTEYDASTREYTVAVQDYPDAGVDSFFVAKIADDISTATMVYDNVIVAHPDASVSHPGSMHLIRVFKSPVSSTGELVAIFNDGSVHTLDLTTKVYKLASQLKYPDVPTSQIVVTNAHVFDGTVLKSFVYDATTNVPYLVTTDFSKSIPLGSAPLLLTPVQGGGSGAELPVNAHIIDNGDGTNILVCIFAGQFDQIIQIDETTGAQSPVIFSITQANDDYPSVLYCDAYGTKECDTVWTTSAYDAANKKLYVQAHWIDEQEDGTEYCTIYEQYYLKQVTGTFPYFDPIIQMNFGYSGYQFVNPASGQSMSPSLLPLPTTTTTVKQHEETKRTTPPRRQSAGTALEVDTPAKVAARALQSKSPTGTIVSAQFWKASGSLTYELRITATYPVDKLGVKNDVNLQTLLPVLDDSHEVFTAFDNDTRSFYVLVDGYPEATSATVWVSTLSADASVATPVHTAVEIVYPAASSPAPLDVIVQKVARILISSDGPLVVFKTGEVHDLDVAGKQFKKRLALISGDLLYGVTHPYATSAQVVDSETEILHSFIFAASEVYLVSTDLRTNTVGNYVGPLTMPGTQDITTGFSPETLINAHMIKLKDGSNSLLLTMESLDSVGFDELNFVNITSGELLGPEYNLMEDDLLLSCGEYNCDKWRVSCYDPDSQVLYLQGHYNPDEVPQISLAALVYTTNHLTGKDYWVINPQVENLNFGYTGFQWVPFLA